MGVLTRSFPRSRGRSFTAATVTLAAALIAAPNVVADLDAGQLSDDAVKAAFLYNFANFTQWPALLASSRLTFCVIGNDRIATALEDSVRTLKIGGHPLVVSRPSSATWKGCQLLFVAAAEVGRAASGLAAITSSPVLTVSDGGGFTKAGGIIELYEEGGRIRFAIDMDGAERAGLLLSSRLLGLAKVTRSGRPH
jgi:hypothetical protein